MMLEALLLSMHITQVPCCISVCLMSTWYIQSNDSFEVDTKSVTVSPTGKDMMSC